uniref:Uncharacterized protein n=1 Tax=Anguilla anguilla TaxID=7936 RepID=A0A0E9SHT1_ANGAN
MSQLPFFGMMEIQTIFDLVAVLKAFKTLPKINKNRDKNCHLISFKMYCIQFLHHP